MDRHIFLFLYQTILSSSTRRKVTVMWWMFLFNLSDPNPEQKWQGSLSTLTPSTAYTGADGLLTHTCLVFTVSRLSRS